LASSVQEGAERANRIAFVSGRIEQSLGGFEDESGAPALSVRIVKEHYAPTVALCLAGGLLRLRENTAHVARGDRPPGD